MVWIFLVFMVELHIMFKAQDLTLLNPHQMSIYNQYMSVLLYILYDIDFKIVGVCMCPYVIYMISHWSMRSNLLISYI